MYAYTYPAAKKSLLKSGYILTKVGDSHRDVDVRIKEQGGAAEWEEKIRIGSWPNLKKIQRDYDVHNELSKRGWHHSGNHNGTEWFKIPGKTVQEVWAVLDKIITDLEGNKSRELLKLRHIQRRTLDQAMDIIANCGNEAASIIANLCPRFGKTVWALSLFNRITEKYGNRVMLLPAYWLSVHTSFIDELDSYADFNGIVQIDVNDHDAAKKAWDAIDQGLRVVIPMSLHGNLSEWQLKHQWIATIPNNEIFMFADEGDFGTHTENQVSKLKFLFDK
jgi:hypothetical protein